MQPVAWISRNRKHKNEDDEELRGDLLQDVPVWLQDFKENHADTNAQPHQLSPSSSHELPIEPRAKVVPGLDERGVSSHFPKDRNCDICLRSKITRASCRRRTGTVMPKAEIHGDLITADQKVLSERGESRHIHRYALGGARFGTSMVTIQETQKMKFRSRRENQKSFTLTIPWNLAKPVKIFPGIIVRQHLTDQKRMRLLREQCAE